MKKVILAILCICMLCFPVKAVENEKLVALTFDDGPSGKYTRKLLNGLEERSAKATFLLCGYRMELYPDITEQIFQDGHEIGLHGYSHTVMQKLCERDVTREFEKVLELVPNGCEVNFLRPPGGICGSCVQSVATKLNLSVLSWSIDPKDWAIHDAKAIEKEVVSHIRDGDVILLHDMSDSSVEAAFAIMDALQEQGFRFVTVSQLAQARHRTLLPGVKYTHFYQTDSQEQK